MIAKSLQIRIPEHLSDRERVVLRELSSGETSKAIALKLGLSIKTIEYYRARIMRRTGLWSIAELTKLALRLGLTEIDV